MTTSIKLEEAIAAVDDYILELIDHRIDQASNIHISYSLMWQEIKQVYQAGGKRLRPYLTIIGYGKLDEKIIPIAAAQELLHVAVLMHDDIIDQDDYRHGQPTMHASYRQIYQKYLPESRVNHYAMGSAMLAGDALISEAYRAINSSQFNDDIKFTVSQRLSTSIFEVIGGELIDVEAAFVTNHHFDAMNIYLYKTASYTMIGPLLAGAYCANLDEATIKIYQDFGKNLGIAFQIQDDILGIFGDKTQTGKSNYTDLYEGKQTVLIDRYINIMSPAQARHFSKYFNNPEASEADLQKLKDDIETSGALGLTEKLAEEYFQKAKRIMENFDADSSRKVSLEQLYQKVYRRKK